MKKQLIAVLAVASIAVGLNAKQNNKMNNKKVAAKKFFEVTIDNTESKKPSVVTLNYDNSPGYMTKTVAAGKKMVLSKKGYALDNIGVRQGRGPASVAAKDGYFNGKQTVKIMSTATGFSMKIMKGSERKGFFGWFRGN